MELTPVSKKALLFDTLREDFGLKTLRVDLLQLDDDTYQVTDHLSKQCLVYSFTKIDETYMFMSRPYGEYVSEVLG